MSVSANARELKVKQSRLLLAIFLARGLSSFWSATANIAVINLICSTKADRCPFSVWKGLLLCIQSCKCVEGKRGIENGQVFRLATFANHEMRNVFLFLFFTLLLACHFLYFTKQIDSSAEKALLSPSRSAAWWTVSSYLVGAKDGQRSGTGYLPDKKERRWLPLATLVMLCLTAWSIALSTSFCLYLPASLLLAHSFIWLMLMLKSAAAAVKSFKGDAFLLLLG